MNFSPDTNTHPVMNNVLKKNRRYNGDGCKKSPYLTGSEIQGNVYVVHLGRKITIGRRRVQLSESQDRTIRKLRGFIIILK